ncbi:phosphate/phosphite/phosphonate ABC transporter substrate-binding protein [Magnetococcus sp. PR-3]|uniref:phosphate/phosphite/phosphonate ABC transporter substrate-binding protein n=1 Tax=Magnetococcus sp. PR-3 TaxID=3120355 RepID=UPI002FCE338B
MLSIRLLLPLFLVMILFTTMTLPARAQPVLTFGVHPFLPATELHKRFQPLIKHLTHIMKRPVRLHVASTYAEHIDNVGNQLVDIAFLGPSPYVKIVKKYGPPKLLAQLRVKGKDTFHGVIFTYQAATIVKLEQLKGKRMAFGDVNSTMSHLVPLHMLEKVGVSKVDLASHQHVQNHVNVIYGVLTGLFDAGAAKESVYKRYAHWGLRVLEKSSAIPNHVIVARSNLPEEVIAEVKKALALLKPKTMDAQLLKALKPGITGLGVVSDKAFDGLRHILNISIPKRGVE